MQETANDDELWRRLDWNDVRIFLAVAESGSLNAAGRMLNMTQSTISRRMEELEYRLGARLFQRSTRGVTLTEAGATVRELAASMARLGGSIIRDVAGRDRTTVGRVRIAAPDGIATFVLMPALSQFQMANPEIHLSVDCGLWPDSPIEGDVDLSLTYDEECPADLVSYPIATSHYALFASREYLKVYGAPKSLGEASEHRWVRHASRKSQADRWHPKAKAVSELAGQHLVSNSSAATLQAIVHGAGIGAVPTAVLAFQPDLVMLDLEPMAHPVLFLRHHAAAERQDRVMRVKEWITSLFDVTDQPWYREEFIHPRDFERFRRQARPAPAAARSA